jgi:hypothetical protein
MPTVQASHASAPHAAGKAARCPACHEAFTVPAEPPPPTVRPARRREAVLVMDKDLQISREEAELYLAGKEGDTLARLIARLMDLKRKYAENTTLARH